MGAHSQESASLDAAALKLFEEKGLANGVKVRRVMQIATDLARRPWSNLRILDLGCGEGVYAIEAGLRGAEVLALDGRKERMNLGRACAERHGLSRVQFMQADACGISKPELGEFDIVFFLGLLYHLDAPQVFPVMEQVHALCRGFVILDTHVALRADAFVEHQGKRYRGIRWKEHAAGDAPEVRHDRQQSSLDHPMSFWFDRESLLRLLFDSGFTSVFECLVPFEPCKPADRVTWVACKGGGVTLASYPWVNGRSEEELGEKMKALQPRPARTGLRGALAAGLQRALGCLGFELRRL